MCFMLAGMLPGCRPIKRECGILFEDKKGKNEIFLWRRDTVSYAFLFIIGIGAVYPSGLRGRSAKPLFIGSNPIAAFN